MAENCIVTLPLGSWKQCGNEDSTELA